MLASDELILVDEHDQPIGTMEKMQAHREGRLHRAFSIFLFTEDKTRMLLQRRALKKYHSGGLLSNTCCSHPRPHETTLQAAHRRLKEELGISSVLHEVFSFIYRVALDNELIEHEFDHVFVGTTDGHVECNPEEVSECCLMTQKEIESALIERPEEFTEWFKIAYRQLTQYFDTIPISPEELGINTP